MKLNAVAIVLILACLALGVVLVVENKKHAEESQKQQDTITTYSNSVNTLEGKLNDQIVVNAALETNLSNTKIEDSNSLFAVKTDLTNTLASLDKSQTDAKAAAAAADAAMAERDKKISDLENQNQELDKESETLRGSITNLETQIQSTQQKLAASEGDKAFLLSELKRLQAEKADLEKKFNDLVVLKEQVRKLKDELSIARKLDWIRRGIYDSIAVKGGERLMHPEAPASTATNTTLNVELRQDGGVSVGTADTNNTSTNK